MIFLVTPPAAMIVFFAVNNLRSNKLGIKCSLGKNSIFTTAYEEVTI
jgi:hypothetical protein